ncbi:MAG: Bor/Iss family lipoprotein [Gemmatirosa sp.]
MRRLSPILLACAAVLSAGCYRVTVVSGAPAAATPAIDVPWAHGFVFGLVPPAPVNVASQCQQGVATVVTEQSLVNGLAQWITGSIYTPQHITVTCASGPVRTSAAPAPATTVAKAPVAKAPVDSTAVVARSAGTKR